MKHKNFLKATFVLFCTLLPLPAFSQAVGGVGMDLVLEILAFILVLSVPLFMIGHMIYVNIDTKRLNRPVSAAKYAEKRRRKGLPEQSSEEETTYCFQLLDEAWRVLSVIETDFDDNEVRSPGKMRELLKSKKIVGRIRKMMPTDENVISHYNGFNVFLYGYLQRSFYSSWSLIVLSVLVGVGISLMGERDFLTEFFTVGSFFWISAIIYFISGNIPQYMINKKEDREGGRGWLVSSLIGGGLGILGGGALYASSDDLSDNMISLFLGIIILMIVAFTIIIWALINYFRNYVLYI